MISPELLYGSRHLILGHVQLAQHGSSQLQARLQGLRHHSCGPSLLEVQAVVHIMRPHIDLHVREVLVEGPHGPVVCAWRVQGDHSAGCSVGAHTVQDRPTASISEVDGQVQLLASLCAWAAQLS